MGFVFPSVSLGGKDEHPNPERIETMPWRNLRLFSITRKAPILGRVRRASKFPNSDHNLPLQHFMLFPNPCEEEDEKEATDLDNCHHEARFLETENGKQEHAAKEPSEEASKKIRPIEQASRFAKGPLP